MHTSNVQLTGPEWLKPLCMALKYCWQCQNGLSHSCTQVTPLAELECQNGSSYYMALKYCWQCQNGSSHSGTQILHIRPCQNGSSHYGTQIWLAVPEWLEPFLHASNAMHWPNLSARMARAILAQPCKLHDLSARMAQAILTRPVA